KCFNENYVICLDNEKYMMYLQCRQKVLLSLAAEYRKRTDVQALSAVALCAYMLSSQILAPNQTLFECRKFFQVLNNVVSFRGRFDKKYLEKHFPKAKISANMARQTKALLSGIKCPQLAQLAEKFSSLPRKKSELGVLYKGTNLYNSRGSVEQYATSARAIFDKHGLGAQGASRFFQLFWEEYMMLVREHWVDSEFKKGSIEEYSLGFECFGYGNNLKQFGVNVKKTDYAQPNPLSLRLQFLLPEILAADIGNVSAIGKKIKMTKAWEMFGSRGAYLQLALNEGVSLGSLSAFREFFILAVRLFMEYLPYNSGQKLLVGEKGLTRFQRTINHTKAGDRKPTLEQDFVEDKYVQIIRRADTRMTTAAADYMIFYALRLYDFMLYE
ncbi:hypothetical protein BDF21DRAFT_486936, partial [Thamnidium elegans]